MVQLQRKPKTASVARLRRRDNDEFEVLRRKAARWAADNFSMLTDPDPAIPDVLNDRAADNWRPLIAIADLAAGRWPQRAREAACLLSGEGHDSSSVNVDLLADIRQAFGDLDVLRSADLVTKLTGDPERPWVEWSHGRPLSPRQLGALLRPFGITSETVRTGAETDLVKVDPTAWVENLPRRKGDGFRPWTEDDVAAYELRWSIGTRQRVWLDVLLYTGLRRGDAVRFGRQHVRDGVGSLKTEKSGETIAVTLPILPVLAHTLAAGPCGDLTFVAGAAGEPLTKESFGNAFREACRAAGVPGSAHGVRKIAATRAANKGATVAQLEAIFGWSGGTMASHYTRSADRQRLAIEAMHKLANDDRTSIPAPEGQVRARKEKNK